MPVYYVGAGADRLYREFHTVTLPADTARGAAIRPASARCCAAAPLDPDYRSSLAARRPACGRSRLDGAVAVVDLAGGRGQPRRRRGGGGGLVQQLVWTVTAVAADRR